MKISFVKFDVVPAENARNYDIFKTLRINFVFHILESIVEQRFFLMVQLKTDLENRFQTLENGDNVRFLVDLEL